MNFALLHDKNNQWFCFLTDSCCPIISPKRFRYLFYNYYNYTIMSWKKHWWNIIFHKRANLALLPEELRLANDPWFVMKRENILHILHFVNSQQKISKTICDGGLANESLFAIIMKRYNNQLDSSVICKNTHITDWSRQTSPTSPHLFKEANELDILFIEKNIKENNFAMFLRKVSPEFPDETLKKYIYEYSVSRDNNLPLIIPHAFIYNYLQKILYKEFFYIMISVFLYIIFYMKE